MLLFRYFGSHGFETFRDARLKASRISTFNDPFECMYRIVGEMTIGKANEYIKSRIHSPVFAALVRQKVPAIKSKNDLRRFVGASRSKAAKHLVDNYELIKNKTSEEREAIMDASLRVICFSESTAKPIDEILMWSHYADNLEAYASNST